MIRPATLADIDGILELAREEMERYPLRPDREKIQQVAREAVSAPKHFCWVGETDGKVTGVVVGLASDNLWAQRQNCNVILWKSIAGEGASLLRKFAEWVKSRRAIKVAGMVPDSDGFDSRAWDLAERIGFKKHGGAYLLYN